MRKKHHINKSDNPTSEWVQRASAGAVRIDEILLNTLISAIEDENDRPAFPAVLVNLLLHGPVVCEPRQPLIVRGPGMLDKVAGLRAELRPFLRSIVSDQAGARPSSAGIAISGEIAINATVTDERPGPVQIAARGAPEDLVKLQVLLLMHLVGLRHIRPCAADGCPRIFVKQYRREFCSKTCQNRQYMRRKREEAANARDRAAFRRRRAR